MNKKFNSDWSHQEKVSFINEVNTAYTHPGSGRGLGLESSTGLEYLEALNILSDKGLKNGFIEIGSAWGASFHYWASLIKGVKISVDITTDMYAANILKEASPSQPWPPRLTSEVFDWRHSKWEAHFDDVYSITGYSCEDKTIKAVRKILNNRKVSFLYIDAEHTYKAVKADYEKYNEFVEPGGFIGFHDINLEPPQNMSGFWDEMREEYGDSSYTIKVEGTKEMIGLIKV